MQQPEYAGGCSAGVGTAASSNCDFIAAADAVATKEAEANE